MDNVVATVVLVLVVVGVGQAGHVPWTALAAAVVAADVLLTAGLGALRGRPVRSARRGAADRATLAP